MATQTASTRLLRIEILHCVPVVRPVQVADDRPVAVVVADPNGNPRRPLAIADDGSPLIPIKENDVFAVATPEGVTLYRVDLVGLEMARGVEELSLPAEAELDEAPFVQVTRTALEAALDRYFGAPVH